MPTICSLKISRNGVFHKSFQAKALNVGGWESKPKIHKTHQKKSFHELDAGEVTSLGLRPKKLFFLAVSLKMLISLEPIILLIFSLATSSVNQKSELFLARILFSIGRQQNIHTFTSPLDMKQGTAKMGLARLMMGEFILPFPQSLSCIPNFSVAIFLVCHAPRIFLSSYRVI